MDPVVYAFFVASAIVMAGFIASILVSRYGLPDSMFLIGIGILIGPILRLIDPSQFLGLAPLVGSIALILIMFESSLGMSISDLVKTARHAVTLSLLTFSLSVSTAALFIHYVIGYSWLESVLYGCIVGGSSGAVVAAIASKVGLPSDLSLILSLESILSDVYCIVSTIVVLEIIKSATGGASQLTEPASIGAYIASKFSVSLVIGFIFGFIIANLLFRARREKHVYSATLATLLFLYSLTEFLGGSGAIAILAAGIILVNMEYMPDFLLSRERVETLRFQRISLESFHSELTLLIKVFFFVEVGLFFSFEDLQSLIFAAILSFILLIVRYPPALLVSKLADLKDSASTITVFYARGLAAAVLAFLPAQYGLASSHSLFFLQSISALVIFTNINLTLIFPLLRKHSQG